MWQLQLKSLMLTYLQVIKYKTAIVDIIFRG